MLSFNLLLLLLPKVISTVAPIPVTKYLWSNSNCALPQCDCFPAINTIDCSNRQLISLNLERVPVSYFANVQILDLRENRLAALPTPSRLLTVFPDIEKIYVADNPLLPCAAVEAYIDQLSSRSITVTGSLACTLQRQRKQLTSTVSPTFLAEDLKRYFHRFAGMIPHLQYLFYVWYYQVNVVPLTDLPTMNGPDPEVPPSPPLPLTSTEPFNVFTLVSTTNAPQWTTLLTDSDDATQLIVEPHSFVQSPGIDLPVLQPLIENLGQESHQGKEDLRRHEAQQEAKNHSLIIGLSVALSCTATVIVATLLVVCCCRPRRCNKCCLLKLWRLRDPQSDYSVADNQDVHLSRLENQHSILQERTAEHSSIHSPARPGTFLGCLFRRGRDDQSSL